MKNKCSIQAYVITGTGLKDLVLTDTTAEIWSTTHSNDNTNRLVIRLSKKAFKKYGSCWGIKTHGMPAEFIVQDVTFYNSIMVSCMRKVGRDSENDPEKYIRYMIFIERFL